MKSKKCKKWSTGALRIMLLLMTALGGVGTLTASRLFLQIICMISMLTYWAAHVGIIVYDEFMAYKEENNEDK